MTELTISELTQALERMGADPSTTIIRVNGESDWNGFDLSREGGRAVVDLHLEDTCGDVLRDDAAYAKWRGEQVPTPANLTDHQRAQAAAFLEDMNGC